MSEDFGRLVVKSVWKHERPDWTDYYVVCTDCILKIEPFVLPEIRELPRGAQQLSVEQRERSDTNMATFQHPTMSTLGKVAYVGTELGDDVVFLLTNGSGIIYYLDSDPASALQRKPEDHFCQPVLLFLEPEDFATFDISKDIADMDPLELSLLEG